MEHLKQETVSGAQLNMDALYQICPQCFTESKDPKTGEVKHTVDFEKLRLLLGDKVPEMIDTFDELKDELAAVGIEFSYYFDADHDRNICLDNGWKINLSRGLDIFEKFGRFSLGSVRQTNRRCRAFSVTSVQE